MKINFMNNNASILTSSTVHVCPSDQFNGTAFDGSQHPNIGSSPTMRKCSPNEHSLCNSNLTWAVLDLSAECRYHLFRRIYVTHKRTYIYICIYTCTHIYDPIIIKKNLLISSICGSSFSACVCKIRTMCKPKQIFIQKYFQNIIITS